MSERKIEPGRLIAATHNSGKVRELRDLMAPLGFDVVSAIELNLPEPEETESTFKGNAILKARAAALATGAPALSDDSGLAVEALNGEPGIYSARWGGPTRDFYLAMEKVEKALAEEGSGNTRAKFVCALAVVWPDGEAVVFEGEVHGTLTFPPRGDKGFGYDPIFIADGETLTFGEMEPAKKHAMSHRADAFAQLKAALMRDD